MAMYPNATKGYMPFVSAPVKRHQGKRTKSEMTTKSKTSADTKTYKVTLRDRNGYTYTYIIQADGTKSLPVLCESKISGPGQGKSLPDIARECVNRHRVRTLSAPCSTSSGDGQDSEKKEKGIFNTLLQFLRKKTASGKSKRKPKPVVQKKRQRTISAMSNLDPIQESPEEDNLDDDDSYTHDSSSDNESVSDHEP
ncbi:hypothetical protein LOTGIDRAFT_228790 [Lottia gigantea]|uniref:Uncharacterized protein n=1 Tax=Lottia gigantea TaxID=225164 RepID=V4BR05_LOTGI|nr:hypothetical protein LOTGIDRAFT_228790 [Lottia gigantea]ESO91329.1 hypothetical protein LOTGIDRAFT_228790 [Lottia gigantea]